MKVRKMEMMALNLPIHVQQVSIEEEQSQRRKEALRIMGVTPPLV